MDRLTPPTRRRASRSAAARQSPARGADTVPRPRSTTRTTRCSGLIALAFACMAASLAHASPGTEAIESPPAGKVQIGPSWDPDRAVWADEDARMRVRGDRPEDASIHVAYAGPEVRWDDAMRRDLATFEASAFPEGQAPRKTIVDKPPEAWMEKLELPDIPVRWNERTVEYLRYFKDDPKGQRLIAAWLNRMGRYEQRLRAIMAEVGVPEDLVYVAMIESGFNPAARSSVGAAGMWQFMEATGRVYGLASEYWTDDRLDFERSAYAAAHYLADLKTRFGTWELALAAYNAGYGLVVQSIRANNTNNYWALVEIENGLPHQTCGYVPKILAAAIVGRNRAAFGVGGTPEPTLDLIEVKIPAGTRIEDLADALDLDADLLAEVNAAYLRGRVSPEGGPGLVRIPRDKHEAFTKLGGELTPPPDQRWSTYEVKLGEDLAEIAAAYDITERQLRKLNGIHDSGEVKGGVILVVPATPAATNPGQAPPLPPMVAVPALAIPAGQRLVFFRVTRASSATAIASSFGVAWQQIVAWNDLDPKARLVDGQILQILVAKDFNPDKAGVEVREPGEVRHVIRGSAGHLDALLADRDMVRRSYKAKKGESFKKIAKKFDLSVGSLARINGVARNHDVDEGDVLIVYVEADETRGTLEAPAPVTTTLTAEIDVVSAIPQRDDRATPREASTAETSRVPGKRHDDN